MSAPATTNLEQSLEEMVDPLVPYAAQKDALLDRFTRVYLASLMRHTAGNQSAAARIAGLNRSYLGRLLVKHGIAKPQADGGWDESDEPTS
jgi:DNA-binding protein Fis